MKFLIDTNILIPLEPTAHSELEEGTPTTIELARLVSQSHSQLYVHPVLQVDIQQDRDNNRKQLRNILFNKYPLLPSPPSISSKLETILGKVAPNTNDWVDHHLIAALDANTVDFLVTEDRKLIKKATKVGLENRVATVAEAIQIVQGFFDVVPTPPPAIKDVKAHMLNENDPIFRSLRNDYPGFDSWLIKCKREHRQAWVVKVGETNLAGICIIKQEENAFHLSGKILKVCCLKISEQHNGFRFGELILKTLFNYVLSNKYKWLYITVLDKYGQLIDFLKDFGFIETNHKTNLREVVLVKTMSFTKSDLGEMDPLEFNIRYGPFIVNFENVSSFIVPIRPEYSVQLFPDLEQQTTLWPEITPFGNSIRKAYLSNAFIRKIKRGDNLIFYRSTDIKSVIAIGIVEDVMVSSKPEEIARFVGKRTVFKFTEIETLCRNQVLAILFRQCKILNKPIRFQELKDVRVLSGAPQSITELSKESNEWLKIRVAE